jgi:uncharacterized membrane protein YphA (DoxX/SURF4 family)
MLNRNSKLKVATILSAILALLYIFFGVPKLMAEPQAVDQFSKYGYPDWFRTIVGIVEVAGGLGLLIPKARKYANFGLIALMIGALFTHVKAEESTMIGLPLLCIIMLSLILWLRK